MTDTRTDTPEEATRRALLDAALLHVPFDGWSDAAFRAAAADAGIDAATARAACPRGAVDLAVLFHRDGDRRMAAAWAAADTGPLRVREKVAFLLRQRLDAAGDKEAVRRGSALFALPHMAPEGARLIWETADAIWTALGDPSEDVNWYTKRATLAGVYASVVLYWLGDDSLDHRATDDFIDRRIDDVMRIEKVKGQLRENRLTRPLMASLGHLGSLVKAPGTGAAPDPPGRWSPPRR